MSGNRTRLSVVFPAFNEEKNIAETLRRAEAFLRLKGWEWEVIVVNDGSRDRTNEAVRSVTDRNPGWNIRLMASDTNRGKGYACKRGILASNGEFILLSDADLSAPIKEVDRLLAELEKGSQVAIGSRAVKGKNCDVRQSFKRRLSGRIFNLFVRAIVLPGIYDSQCGFKLFTREAAHRIFQAQKIDGFSFDVEALYLARKMGMKVSEVPVMWSQGPDTRVNLLRDPFFMIQDLFRIKKLHR